MPLDNYVSISLSQIEALAGPNAQIEHRRLTISGREAEEITYQYEMMNFVGQSVAGSIVQYLLLDDGAAYVITMIAPLALEDTYISVFKEIGQTFTLLE